VKITRNLQTLASAAILLASLSACSTVGKVTDGVTGTAGKVAGAAKNTAGAAADVVTGGDEADALASRRALLDCGSDQNMTR